MMATAPKPLHIGPAATSETRRQNSHQRTGGRKFYRLVADIRTDNPLCERCKERGHIVAMKVRDHIIPHRGNLALRDDPDNVQMLCEACHNLKTYWETRGVIIFVTPRRREFIDVEKAGYVYRPLDA